MASSLPNPSLLRRHLLASICGGMAVLILGIYAIRFGLLDEAKQLLAQSQSEADGIHRNLRNAADLQEHLVALQNGLVRLEEKLMRSGDVAAYQQYFFKLESDSGVKIARLLPAGAVRVGQAKPTGAYRPMGFDVTVEGAFADVVRFLRNLESGSRHYRLVSFSVRRGGGVGAGQSNLVSLAIGLELMGSQ